MNKKFMKIVLSFIFLAFFCSCKAKKPVEINDSAKEKIIIINSW